MVARIVRLSLTPIKGTALHHPESLRLTASGAEGDRAFFLATEDDRLISIFRTGAVAHVRAEYDAGRSELALFDGRRELCRGTTGAGVPVAVDFYGERIVTGRHVDGPWDAVFSGLLGRPVRLVRADHANGGIDEEPATLLGTASIAAVGRQLGEPVDGRRFRMLIEVETTEPHAEDTWRGALLAGDEVQLRVGGPVLRCAAVTRHPDTGTRDQDVLRAIKQYRGVVTSERSRGLCFGVYAGVVAGGTLRTGEVLRVVGPSSDP
ncbi:MAG TPA: MOSC domain-containing protein [Solirubrobacteraceae bacterium]|nr:MOSC domain-containing protein [Solirubrobacteraceae bacterium]